MHVAFSHDAPFYKYKNMIYVFSDKQVIANRLKYISSDITFILREYETNKAMPGYSLIKNGIDNVNFVGLPNFLVPQYYYTNRKRAYKIIERVVADTDLLVARVPSLVSDIAISCAKKYNKPCLLEVVSCAFDAFWNHDFYGKLIAPYIEYITKKSIWDADFVIYVTDNYLQRKYPTKGFSIGCSDVDIGCLDMDVIFRQHERYKMGLPKHVILGSCGGIDIKIKGYKYVIEAMAKLKKRGINLEYRLAGMGDNSSLSKLAIKYGLRDNVHFVGNLNHEDILKFLDGINIYVQPSIIEGLPRSVIEALSRACPVIVSNAGGNTELVDKIWSFKVGDVNDLTSKIEKMLYYDVIKIIDYNWETAKKFENQTLKMKREVFYDKILSKITRIDKTLHY